MIINSVINSKRANELGIIQGYSPYKVSDSIFLEQVSQIMQSEDSTLLNETEKDRSRQTLNRIKANLSPSIKFKRSSIQEND